MQFTLLAKDNASRARLGELRLAHATVRTPLFMPCASLAVVRACDTADIEQFRSIVYAHPQYLSTLDRSTPISAHVGVDGELRGCPVDAGQLLELIAATVQGRAPRLATYSVCVECKRRGAVCVAVAHGTACLGPVTQAGCGAICPAMARGCYGCFGPAAQAGCDSLADWVLADRTTTRLRNRSQTSGIASYCDAHSPIAFAIQTDTVGRSARTPACQQRSDHLQQLVTVDRTTAQFKINRHMIGDGR